MYDPNENKFVHVNENSKVSREWTRFAEGETVDVKGITFRIHEIGETRLILKPIDRAAFAAKTVSE